MADAGPEGSVEVDRRRAAAFWAAHEADLVVGMLAVTMRGGLVETHKALSYQLSAISQQHN